CAYPATEKRRSRCAPRHWPLPRPGREPCGRELRKRRERCYSADRGCAILVEDEPHRPRLLSRPPGPPEEHHEADPPVTRGSPDRRDRPGRRAAPAEDSAPGRGVRAGPPAGRPDFSCPGGSLPPIAPTGPAGAPGGARRPDRPGRGDPPALSGPAAA